MAIIEHVLTFSTQADADDVFQVPLDTSDGPLALESLMVYQSAVAGSPTAVTLDLDITDGTVTKNAIAAGAILTAAGTTRLAPSASVKETGDHEADAEDRLATSPAYWRYEIDFNFTAGSSPTTTGFAVVRWRK